MRPGEIYFRRLPLQSHAIRQEDFVADLETRATELLRFCGVDWDPRVLEFPDRARKTANTPSAAQIARGLSDATIGVWRHYGADLSPVLPILEPWAAKFGYAPADIAAFEAEARRRAPAMSGAPAPVETRARAEAALNGVKAAIAGGDLARAFALSERALEQGTKDPLFYRMRGVLRQQQGRLTDAVADLTAALADNPKDAGVLNALGLCLARGGRPADGLARLDAAIALTPDFAPAHFNRGWAMESMGDLAGAREAYERAVALDPHHAQGFGALAALAVRAAEWDEARTMATRALAIEAGQPVATIALATAEAASGELDAAQSSLRTLAQEGGRANAQERAVALGALGDVLEKAKRYADAAESYEAAAAILRQLHAPRFDRPGLESAPAFVRRLEALFDRADPARWAAPAAEKGGDIKGHVFLLGFPRSGTTFVGQVLAANPGVETLDERETLVDAVEAYMRRADSLAPLQSISPVEADRYRGLYWRRVNAAGAAPAGKVFVDKLPMNTLGLPLIAQLFPNARVVFMRRDPRDVVWSAFRRQFAINATTFEFLTLAGAARLYDAVMRLNEKYMQVLKLHVRVQRYEDLVGAFERQTKALCDFVGVRWTDEMKRFSERARAVATPSAAQIARGLTSEGVGAWRPYRGAMAEALAILAPWVERFGYGKE
jgi:Tfp pilus assembly protein PilF